MPKNRKNAFPSLRLITPSLRGRAQALTRQSSPRFFWIASLTLAMTIASVNSVRAQETSGGFGEGSILVGFDNRTCNVGLEGSIRYNSSTSFEYCNGSSWATIGGGTPAGANTQIQFNNSGAFGASTNLTYDGTTFTASSSTAGSNGTIWGKNTATSGTGVRGDSSSGTSGIGVAGNNTASSGTAYGVYGYSASTSGRGVYGTAGAATGGTYGGYFVVNSTSNPATAVYGLASGTSGNTFAARFINKSSTGRAVYAESDDSSGTTNYGVYGLAQGSTGYGLFGSANHSTGVNYGIYGTSNSTNGFGIYCQAWNNANGCAGNRAWYNASDARLKDQIADLPDERGLETIMRLRPVTYHWKGTEELHKEQRIGLIAQEVLDLYPELVGTNGPDQEIEYDDGSKETIENTMSMSYAELVVPLVKAVQQQQAQIEELQAANDNLTAANDDYRAAIEALSARIEALEAH